MHMYTVKKLSALAGVTPRTLRYYDHIGLLKPETVGKNSYRYYSEKSILCLQQILFYRELGFSLEAIRKVINKPDFKIIEALEEHRGSLQAQVERIKRLLQTIDGTIHYLKGENSMSPKELFEGFSEQEQEFYARQAEQIYDPDIVRKSNRKWNSYSAEKKQAILDEGKQIYSDMLSVLHSGPDSNQTQAVVERWRRHINNFWKPDLDQLLGLATMYGNNPDFKTNFDQIHPDLTDFFRQAVAIYIASQKSKPKKNIKF